MRMSCLMAICGLLIMSSPGSARAQAPIPGQPYQVPAELAGFAPGSVCAYGGFNYVIRGGGTMPPADQPGPTYTPQYGPPVTAPYYITQPQYVPWHGYSPHDPYYWHHRQDLRRLLDAAGHDVHRMPR